MKFKIGVLYSIVLVISLLSCESKNEIPTVVKTKLTEKHERIIGTSTSLVLPKDYNYNQLNSRYEKDVKTFFTSLEVQIPFKECAKKFTKQKIKSKGTKLDSYSKLMMNENEAIYIEGSSKVPNETILMLIIGDTAKSTILYGHCETGNIIGRKEMKKIFETMHFHSNEIASPENLLKVEFDQSITGYKYNSMEEGFFLYSPNGKLDGSILENDVPALLFKTTLEKDTIEGRKLINESIGIIFKNDGFNTNSLHLKREKIKGKTIFITKSKFREKNNSTERNLFVTVMLEKGLTIICIGIAYEDVEEFEESYRKTLESIIKK